MYNYKSENTRIKTIPSPGFSCLMISLFRKYLTLNFVPWRETDHNGIDIYCRDVFRSTTLDLEGAASFYRIAKSIIDGSGSDKQVQIVLRCKRKADLVFEYKRESDGQMVAYLAINKEDLTIPFRFPIRQYNKFDEDGQKVTKIIQSGLGAFAKALDEYLTRNGADDKSNKLPVNFNEYQEYSKQVSFSEVWHNPQL